MSERVSGSNDRRGVRTLPGLDGLRALAVAAVIAYHLAPTSLPGGFLGVDVFFVLSGYLITSQLWVRSSGGGIDLLDFWRRRVRRLLPAVIALVLACAVAMGVLDRSGGRSFLGDALAALTYTSNWWYIAHQRSYFEAAGRPPVLQHLWSLAIEEQFYLLWPLVLVGAARLVPHALRRRRLLRTLAVAGALVSVALMGVGTALAHAPQRADVSRWYFGSDAHGFGLLAGAALALHRGGAGFAADRPLRRATARDTRAGWLALLVVLAVVLRADAWSPWVYRWGFAVLALAMTALVAVAARPGPFARLLGARPLVLVGQRSYGLYLWHWPVVCFTRPQLDLPLDGLPLLALRLVLTVVLTEASYRFVETPIRRRGLRAWSRQLRARITPSARPLLPVGALTVTCALALWLMTGPQVGPSPAGGGGIDAAVQQVAAPSPSPSRPSPTPGRTAAPGTLAVYGDSVALGAEPALRAQFPVVLDHATVGIQAADLLDRLSADARAGQLAGAIVLLHLGDNGVVDPDQLASVVRATLADGHARRVLLVRPRVPRDWQQRNLDVIDEVARQVDGVRPVDWYTASAGRRRWFADDGVHVGPAGARAYAALVQAAAR